MVLFQGCSLQLFYSLFMVIPDPVLHIVYMPLQRMEKRKRAHSGLHRGRGLDGLRRQRAALEEEVRQLRAAVQIYTEVARRLANSTGE